MQQTLLNPPLPARLAYWAAATVLLLASHADALELPPARPVPGGLAVVELGHWAEPPVARFGGRPVMVLENRPGHYVAVVGLALSTRPGRKEIRVQGPDGMARTVEFKVRPHEYESQHITLKNKRMVNPKKRDLERIGREQARIRKALAHWSPAAPPRLRLDPPVQAPVSSRFGLRRFFNGQARKPHSGLDLAAAEGTPVRAPLEGRVVDTGAFFFNGNTVFIDHGQGLITMYCHLSRIDVKPGQWLERGQVIGAVGHTGRVTAAHLHWSVSLNDARIDPALLTRMQAETTAP
ncbi:MAG TPA: M23 family metallopeptidase [Gammaproteobacteria bacterium]|nr:M23 family metallopeptidase [Gammaproteobacteria bacterium]